MQLRSLAHATVLAAVALTTSTAHAGLQTWRLSTTSSGNQVPASAYAGYAPDYLPPIPTEFNQGNTVTIDLTIDTETPFGPQFWGNGYAGFLSSMSVNNSPIAPEDHGSVRFFDGGLGFDTFTYSSAYGSVSFWTSRNTVAPAAYTGVSAALESIFQPGTPLTMAFHWGGNLPSPVYVLTVTSYQALSGVPDVPEAGSMALALSGLGAISAFRLLRRRRAR